MSAKKSLTKSVKHPSVPDGIDINSDFADALSLMENTNTHLFLTGRAGTGKSTLLNYFRSTTSKNVVVVAPTGIAALNVGGQTIHSFFRFPLGTLSAERIKVMKNKKLYQAIDTIVVDEVSMVRADIIDGIDRFMRLNGRDKHQPFGGAQMIFIGDLFQLPPVVQQSEDVQLFDPAYDSPYFFSAAVFKKAPLKTLHLKTIYRQKDAAFIRVLNAIRINYATPDDLEKLNTRVEPDFVPSDDDFYITLTTTNEIANRINEQKLAQLKSKSYQFAGDIEGEFDRKNLPADEILSLKKGAQVMFVKNDVSRRWVNGTIGKVKDIGAHFVKVEIENEDERKMVTVERVDWEILKYDFDATEKKIFSEPVGSFTQFPLKLAWAITIHKSQGKTFEKVIIDLGRGAFAHGQLYVALSRCRTLEGIVLRREINKRDVIVDGRIIEFVKKTVAAAD